MKRSPGRPPLDDDDESVPVHLVLPSKQYDELFKRSREERSSVQDVIRRDLRAQQKKNAK